MSYFKDWSGFRLKSHIRVQDRVHVYLLRHVDEKVRSMKSTTFTRSILFLNRQTEVSDTSMVIRFQAQVETTSLQTEYVLESSIILNVKKEKIHGEVSVVILRRFTYSPRFSMPNRTSFSY